MFIAYPFYREWGHNKELRALEKALLLISDAEGQQVDLSKVEDLTLTQKAIQNVLELEILSTGVNQLVLDETTDENLNIAPT